MPIPRAGSGASLSGGGVVITWDIEFAKQGQSEGFQSPNGGQNPPLQRHELAFNLKNRNILVKRPTGSMRFGSNVDC
jgi:hypothetical protein